MNQKFLENTILEYCEEYCLKIEENTFQESEKEARMDTAYEDYGYNRVPQEEVKPSINLSYNEPLLDISYEILEDLDKSNGKKKKIDKVMYWFVFGIMLFFE